MQQFKSILVLVLIVAVVLGMFVGIKRLWHKQGVKGRFGEFRDALEMNDLRLFDILPVLGRTFTSMATGGSDPSSTKSTSAPTFVLQYLGERPIFWSSLCT